MSDELQNTIYYVARTRAVIRDGHSKMYYVYDWDGRSWNKLSRGYVHSTSAYAHLGRIVNHEAQEAVIETEEAVIPHGW